MRHVSKAWRSGDPRDPAAVRVLNGASLAILAGETVAVVAGPSAGGSTLLLVAAGIARPDAGVVYVPKTALVGDGVHYVPTSPALPQSATPRELLLERAAGCCTGDIAEVETERQLRQHTLASVSEVALRELPPVAAWLTALATARLRPGLLLVDRPPDDAHRWRLTPQPALAVAESAPMPVRAELHVVRHSDAAPRGARLVQLRRGVIDGLPPRGWQASGVAIG